MQTIQESAKELQAHVTAELLGVEDQDDRNALGALAILFWSCDNADAWKALAASPAYDAIVL